jgi:hypothetical protein
MEVRIMGKPSNTEMTKSQKVKIKRFCDMTEEKYQGIYDSFESMLNDAVELDDVSATFHISEIMRHLGKVFRLDVGGVSEEWFRKFDKLLKKHCSIDGICTCKPW